MLISGLFVFELFLRVFAFRIKPLVSSCVQVFDSCVVLVAFGLSLFAVSTPILAGRSARILLLLRGGTRISRAISKANHSSAGGGALLAKGTEMTALSSQQSEAVKRKLEPGERWCDYSKTKPNKIQNNTKNQNKSTQTAA